MATESIDGDQAEIEVRIVDTTPGDDGKEVALPARVIITDAAGKHPDGSGRGVYADGRFFVDGQFKVSVAAGETKVHIRSGPHVVPLEQKVTVAAGQRVKLQARLHRWFEPEKHGWYGGDNHVHTQHDRKTAIRVGPEYTAHQARANGLAFITEADNEVTRDQVKQFDTPSFLYRLAPEIRPGPFVGHLNSPGIANPLPEERYRQLVNRVLPRQALHAAVRELGGAMIHTHPVTPIYQLHWMGAGEAWSDAVLGNCADLLDVDGEPAEMLWFAMLNLGNRIGCSSYTDCALGRLDTPSPGDRRVYCKADRLDYGQIVQSMRSGRTVATNGGPLFVEGTIGGKGIGETLELGDQKSAVLNVRCNSLLPLATLELIAGGKRIYRFDVRGREGDLVLEHPLQFAGDSSKNAAGWYVLRAENEKRDWAITSPIYVDSQSSQRDAPDSAPASAMLFEISNHTRYTELRRDFFAHAIATVRPPEGLKSVAILREGEVVRRFDPNHGDRWHEGRVPVTGTPGEYGPGWAWHQQDGAVCHLQADWPVETSGWYSVEVITTKGRMLRSTQLRFEKDAKPSQAISSAELVGPGTRLSLQGYGEEIPRAEIKLPFDGDHWWYPERTYWRLDADLHSDIRHLKGGGNESAAGMFRTAE